MLVRIIVLMLLRVLVGVLHPCELGGALIWRGFGLKRERGDCAGSLVGIAVAALKYGSELTRVEVGELCKKTSNSLALTFQLLLLRSPVCALWRRRVHRTFPLAQRHR
jgi:hypothetical protein